MPTLTLFFSLYSVIKKQSVLHGTCAAYCTTEVHHCKQSYWGASECLLQTTIIESWMCNKAWRSHFARRSRSSAITCGDQLTWTPKWVYGSISSQCCKEDCSHIRELVLEQSCSSPRSQYCGSLGNLWYCLVCTGKFWSTSPAQDWKAQKHFNVSNHQHRCPAYSCSRTCNTAMYFL